jgi:hypothetical protein
VDAEPAAFPATLDLTVLGAMLVARAAPKHSAAPPPPEKWPRPSCSLLSDKASFVTGA